jgi:tetratricopeptide (TPR) repeat protein
MARVARLPAVGLGSATDRVADRRIPLLRTRYYAFLSYSHKDTELADWLHRELEKFRVPASIAGRLTANGVVPKRLTPIFRDQHDLSAGADLGEEIKAVLAASQFLVVLCSPTAATSRWTNQEIESFKRTRPEGCVLAAIASGEPFASEIAGREDEECFPPALRYKYDRRGHQTTKKAEPLAADFREDGNGQRMAFLKLVAGMLGVGLDDLVQREQTRRQRRWGWLAAASLGGMAVTSTLAVLAVQSRNEAREQRREAEGLVEYMVGDLRAKLEPIGRLDALDGVGTRVLAYYRKQDASELTDDALLQRSQALNLMAKVAYFRGHLDEADGLYRQAMAGTAEAVRRSPNDTKRIFDHAQNVFWIGEIARSRGQYGEAEVAYREYKRLGDQLVTIEPDNLKWRMESLYGKEDVGIALYDERRFSEAAQQFNDALAPMKNLVSLDPANLTYQNELSTVLAWAADSQRSLGDLDRASALRQQQIGVLNRVADSGATDVQVHQSLIPAHEALGILFGWRGQSDNAVKELQSAVTEAEQLIPIEPTNNLWKQYAAGAQLELAKQFFADAKQAEAAGVTNQACATVARLRRRDMANAAVATLETDCLKLRTRLELQSGSTPQALELAKQSLASAQAERSGNAVRDRYSIAVAYTLLGDVRSKAGDLQGARTAWTTGIAQLPPNVVEVPLETQERINLLRRLGRADEARALDQQLSKIGFHSIT